MKEGIKIMILGRMGWKGESQKRKKWDKLSQKETSEKKSRKKKSEGK